MNLDIGYYKIKNRSRRASNEFHYLRVLVEGNNTYVQIDDGINSIFIETINQ